MDKPGILPLANEYQLNKLKDGLRTHRHVDAVRALRDLIGLGLSNWRDNYPNEQANVPLKTCIDIVRAIDDLIPLVPVGSDEPEHDPDCHDPVNAEYVLCIWPGVAGERAQSYRYFDYKEAMEDADRHLHDASYGPDATISVSRVLAVSKTTRTMVKL